MPILKSKSLRSSNNVQLSETVFEYATDGANAGRLAKRTRTHYANDGTGDTFVTTETLACTDDSSLPGALLYARTVTTHDDLTRSSSRSRSRFTDRLWKEVNAQGVTDSYEYDCVGRMIESTLALGTQYENAMTVDYFITGGQDEAFQVVTTDCNKNKVCEGLDGAGRRVYTAINDVDDGTYDAQYKAALRTYDELGRMVGATGTDWLIDPSETYTLATTAGYDEWGQLSNWRYGDGTYRIKDYDPIAMTTTVSRGGTQDNKTVQTGQTVTTYEVGGRPVKVARYAAGADVATSAPYSTRTMAYDGLHRLRSQTDALGHTTTYEYDDWDRVIQSTLPDGTICTRRYRADAASKQVVEITLTNAAQNIQGRSVGERVFDGQGRLKSATIGGRTQQYEFDSDADVRPTKVTAPDGVLCQYTYIPELHNRIGTVSAPKVTQTFLYDKLTGSLASAVEGASTKSYDPKSSGRLKAESLTFDGRGASITYDQYTVGGNLYQYTLVDKSVCIVGRNPQGKISEVSDGTMGVTMHYDPAGRLDGWTAYDLPGKQHTLQTVLVFDDYGRETSRTLLENGTQQWAIVQQWNEADLLIQRTTSHPTVQYRQETYGYDARNRLTSWTCSGDLPSDRYGHPMLSQTFKLDAFSNVTHVTTSFDKGPKNDAAFVNDAGFVFDDAKDPCKLTRITNSVADSSYSGSVVPTYDAAGRVTDDGMGQQFEYDSLGRMTRAQSTVTGRSGTYAYDAHDRIYSQTRDDKEAAPSYFYYKADALVNVVQSETDAVRMLRSPAGCTSQFVKQDGVGGLWLTGSDRLGTVFYASKGSATEEYRYSPYGEDNPTAPTTALGYAGQYRDPVVPGYQLGGGYRAYTPALMRFNASDNSSPFGKGGINTYAYCAGDPVNRLDIDGHSFWGDIGGGLEQIKNTAEDFFEGFGEFFSNLSQGFAEGLAASVPGTGVQLGAARGAEGVGEVLGDTFNTFLSMPEMAEEEMGVEGAEAGLRALSEVGAIGEEAGGASTDVWAASDSAQSGSSSDGLANSRAVDEEDYAHLPGRGAPPAYDEIGTDDLPRYDEIDTNNPPAYQDTGANNPPNQMFRRARPAPTRTQRLMSRVARAGGRVRRLLAESLRGSEELQAFDAQAAFLRAREQGLTELQERMVESLAELERMRRLR